MVDLANLTIGEHIIDPCCGTGGFLIRSYDVLSEKIRNSEMSQKAKETSLDTLANELLVGVDWEPRAARTCKMNMIIHGDGHAGVYHANALDLDEVERKVSERRRFHPRAPTIEPGSFNVVLTNPPFGAKDVLGTILTNYDLGRGRKSQKREVLLLERCVNMLRPGGRIVVVIPEGMLSNKKDDKLRSFLTKECVIKAIIRLPQDAFAMSEGAACTSILYAVKKDPDDPGAECTRGHLFARAEYIGFTPSGKPTPKNDLLTIREQFRRFEAGEWDGIEMRALSRDRSAFVREQIDRSNDLWLEPTVNRTSLLYDRLSYTLSDLNLTNRFSYTFHHPLYYKTMIFLEDLPTPKATLRSICETGFPHRGKKPSEESMAGIPILKVRNVTGRGISMDTDNSPDTEQIREECKKAIIRKNDVLITSTGEGTIGRVEIYLYDEPSIADGHVTICRLKAEIDSHYVVEFLRSEHGQIQMLRHISGSTGQTELLIDHIAALVIPLPPTEIQRAVIETMAKARMEAEELTGKADELRTDSSRLIASARETCFRLMAAANSAT